MLHLSTITPVVHTCFIGSFFSPSSSNISQSRLETFLVLPSFFGEERIKDFVTKKEIFSRAGATEDNMEAHSVFDC